MLIARENYACLHISRDHEGYAFDEYMLISGMLITRVNCMYMMRLLFIPAGIQYGAVRRPG